MNEHFDFGEVQALFLYLDAQSRMNREAENIRGIANVVESDRSAGLFDLSIYEMKSTFGNNSDDISINARNHLANCKPCLRQYRGEVVRVSINCFQDHLFGNEKPGMAIPIDKLLERIARNDYLAVFYSQRIN